MKKKTTLLSVAMLAMNVSFAQNFSTVYSFTDVTSSSGLTDPTPVPTAIGVTFGAFSAVGISANSNAGGRFSFANWPTGAITGDDNFSSLTGMVNTSEYYEVTISPSGGYNLDLENIVFDVQRSGTGIRTYVVRSSVDGYAANLSAFINPLNVKLNVETGNVFFWTADATSTSQTGSIITLGSNFTNLSAPVTFRFYGYNAEGSSGTFSIDNVTFTGTANAISTVVINTGFSKAVNIYPNPSATGIFTIDAAYEKGITVYNLLGKIVFTKNLTISSDIIDLSGIDNGTYLVTVKSDTAIHAQLITISK